ncbi:MAG: nucleotide sugar dehydrogenase [Bacteroidia bacterium]|nr:nucleotide sugar dehydrogenase [Bacteroidia bacterium]
MNNRHKISTLFCNKDATLFQMYEIFEQASKDGLPAGIALVVSEDNVLVGTVTEGDIRRGLLKYNDMKTPIKHIMQNDPICFRDYLSISEILEKIPAELEKRNRQSKRYLGKIVLVDEEKRPTRVLDYHQLWEQKVASHRHLVVVGLGYVGLTMALVMADAGFMVTGVELDKDKVKQLNSGSSYIHELGLEDLLKENIGKNFRPVSELPENGDVFIISVGTPVIESEGKGKTLEMRYLEDACEKIGQKLRTGNLVILRSTVPIGTCRNFVLPKLEEISGLKCGIDFHLAFAPERTAEGKALKELRSLPQIIGGYNLDSQEATAAIFRDLTPSLVRVDSLEVAEMAKLINNSFRDYVFAYSNQMAKIAHKFNINVVDVINAANKDYTRNPVPLPSPGVGGPCLTKDPFIFASVAQKFDFDESLFVNGRLINESMHEHVANQVLKELNLIGKNPENSVVFICGLAFKGNPETGDIRSSSSIEIAEMLKGKVKEIRGFDPVALVSEIESYGIISRTFEEGLEGADVVMFLNNHKAFESINTFEMTRKLNENPIVYDGWNIIRKAEVLSTRPATYIGLSYRESSIRK